MRLPIATLIVVSSVLGHVTETLGESVILFQSDRATSSELTLVGLFRPKPQLAFAMGINGGNPYRIEFTRWSQLVALAEKSIIETAEGEVLSAPKLAVTHDDMGNVVARFTEGRDYNVLGRWSPDGSKPYVPIYGETSPHPSLV